ncbi:hypothetical protein GA0070216_102353 [Micromonospora matsumotoense]|uniref:Uncharacterized protein n=1 Tax=Micromonospora matsumotoense TaxID=121616 RepID=A0A1C4VGM1_9ACTN|nr:hypothetical protein [Micromonospora matsumotoense]SCE82981.1 hypothetical protein GA0070216_102353 [Micromonospora matsumotoense]
MTVGPPLTEVELVHTWDSALGRPGPGRGLLLLGRADADRLPVGEVTALLLAAAAGWTGGRVAATVDCRACPEHLEVTLTVADLLAAAPQRTDPDRTAGPFTLTWRGHLLTLRLPTTADLAGAARAGDAAAAERWLFDACLLDAVPPLADPSAALPAVSAAMADRDPLGVVAVSLTCPSCGGTTEALLDVPAWAWQAADARVRRLLDEVHRLARAYGWSEAEVLALGPHRRAAYLERVP